MPWMLSSWTATTIFKRDVLNRPVVIPEGAWEPLRRIIEEEMNGRLIVEESSGCYEVLYEFPRKVDADFVTRGTTWILDRIVENHTE